MFGTALCAIAAGTHTDFSGWTRRGAIVAAVLLLYAIFTFMYFYRTTGGASSVSVLDGRYLAMYKSRVIRNITEQEYRMFPNLWIRVMSAWMGMMASAVLMHFHSDNLVDLPRRC
jgi:hypothetical protein